MAGMVDTHIHVVPGVDDGSAFMDMSIMMIIRSYEQGVCKVIATPHGFSFLADSKAVRSRFDALSEEIGKSPFDIPLCLGSEIFMDGTNTDNVIRALKGKILPTMNETDYVLTEFNTKIDISAALGCVERLTDKGYKPIIAHAERYVSMSSQDIGKLIGSGCLIQINVWSIFEEQNEIIKGNARRMLDNKYVTFLGSDSHGMYYRPPELTSGLDYLAKHYDAQYVENIMSKNAERLFGME